MCNTERMKRITIILLILFSAIFSFSQNDSLKFDKKTKDRFVIWLIPSASKNIYGIAIGPVGSEAICNKPYTKYSHGLNVQIPGQGILQVFYILNSPFKQSYKNDIIENEVIVVDTSYNRVIHNGLLLSLLGTFSDQVNGVSISGWMSLGKNINGVSANLLWNLYHEINGLSIGVFNSSLIMQGVQIGFINKTIKLKGVQIGFWNRNEKRSLPLVNWNFKE